jgi:hypothetical protein
MITVSGHSINEPSSSPPLFFIPHYNSPAIGNGCGRMAVLENFSDRAELHVSKKRENFCLRFVCGLFAIHSHFFSALWYYNVVRTQQKPILPLFSFYLIAPHRQTPVGSKPFCSKLVFPAKLWYDGKKRTFPVALNDSGKSIQKAKQVFSWKLNEVS